MIYGISFSLYLFIKTSCLYEVHIVFRYLQKKNENKTIQEEDNEESDAESVNDDEFEEMLNKMAGKKKTDDDSDSDLDYMKEIGNSLRNSKDGNF